MQELTLSDYKAVLDLVTSLVSVKSISAFGEMLISAKEQLGFTSLSMMELEFHKTCTYKVIYTDHELLENFDEYVVPADYYHADPIFTQILEGKEVLFADKRPAFTKEIISPDILEVDEVFANEFIHILAKMNRETMTASLIVYTAPNAVVSKKLSNLAGYLHAHLLCTFVRIMSVSDKRVGKLSDREISVLTWLKYGKTSWEISKILNITENTVNFHIKNIKNKLNATNRQHAVAIALAKNIIE